MDSDELARLQAKLPDLDKSFGARKVLVERMVCDRRHIRGEDGMNARKIKGKLDALVVPLQIGLLRVIAGQISPRSLLGNLQPLKVETISTSRQPGWVQEESSQPFHG